MTCSNNFLCILVLISCQVYMVYSSCIKINELSGSIANTYTARGASLYHKCWTLQNPDENPLYIHLQNISLHNRPAISGALTIKLLSENKVYTISSQSELRNLTTTSSVVEIHFKVNSAHFFTGMVTSFRLYYRIDCNRVLLEPTGILSNPNYPGDSPIGAECIYEIIFRPGYLINITFHNVRIGYDEHCNYKYIKVHDGDSQESPLIAQLCGRIVSYPIISTKNYMWIHFKDDFLGSRFYANYTAVEIDEMPTKTDMVQVSDIVTSDSRRNLQTSSTEENLESTTQKLRPLTTEPTVKIQTQIDIRQVGETATTESTKILQTSFTEENLGSGVQKLSPSTTETKDLTSKDVLKMEVKEHQYRIEVLELQKEILELQKRYESDRLEYQKSFETEKLKKMRQLHDAKARVIEKGFDKNHFEE